MNRTKIEWCDFSWNPITGCSHGCWYCYAKKLAQRFPKIFPNGFKPTFYFDRLQEPWLYKKPSRIFVCSIADIFAQWTNPNWRDKVIRYAYLSPVPHTFIFLTKNPELIPPRFTFPKNFWMGTTVTNEDGDSRNIEEIKKVHAGVRFVSFEPLLGALPEDVNLEGINWIIIGKLTGSKRVKLDLAWVYDIIRRADQLGIPIFMKDNLMPDIPREMMRREFPDGM